MTDVETVVIEPTPTPEPEETSLARKVVIPAVVIIVAIILVGFLASRSGLDKALLRQRIDALAISLAENGKREGRDIKLTYKDLAITGSFSNRHALIIEPAISIKPLASNGKVVAPEDELVVKTAQIAIYPKAVDLSQLRIEAADPVDFFGGNDLTKKLLTVKATEPFVVDVDQSKTGERTFVGITHQVPASIDLTYLREQQAEGVEDATPAVVPVYEILTVTQAPGGVIKSRMAQDGSGLGEAEVAMKDIVITPQVQPEGSVKVAEITSKWSHVLNEQNHHIITASAKLGDVTAPDGVLPYAPLGFAFDASYEGVAPQSAEDVAALRAQETSFKLNNFVLSAKDAKLSASANFTASGNDVLPVGNANLNLTNVPFVLGQLRQYGLVNPNNEQLVDEVLQLVTGQPLAEITDADIAISRPRGGSFVVGKSTFEELFAVVLKNAMQHRVKKVLDIPDNATPAPAITPVTPGEQAPAVPAEQKKIMIEDGARG